VRHVGAGGGGDTRAQTPSCEGWYALTASAGIEGEYARGQDEAIHGERDEACGHAGIAVRANQSGGAPVGDDTR
jgi:hypothetical protein